MATQIMLIVQIDDVKITPSVIINPYYSDQGFANPPKLNPGLIEGYTVNEVHREVLDFATEIIKRDRAQEFERE